MKSLPAVAVLALVAGAFAPAARADSNDLFTASLGAGVSYTSAPGAGAGAAASFELDSRIKFLYLLGLDLMVAPTPGSYDNGSSAPSLRLSALLYILNFDHFSLFGAAGTAGDSFGDLVDLQGASTHYRAGGGMEFTLKGHFSIGLEGYWLVPGAGMVVHRVEQALLETGQVMTFDQAVQTDGFELFGGLRFYL